MFYIKESSIEEYLEDNVLDSRVDAMKINMYIEYWHDA
jgi:hypothetical protein